MEGDSSPFFQNGWIVCCEGGGVLPLVQRAGVAQAHDVPSREEADGDAEAGPSEGDGGRRGGAGFLRIVPVAPVECAPTRRNWVLAPFDIGGLLEISWLAQAGPEKRCRCRKAAEKYKAQCWNAGPCSLQTRYRNVEGIHFLVSRCNSTEDQGLASDTKISQTCHAIGKLEKIMIMCVTSDECFCQKALQKSRRKGC